MREKENFKNKSDEELAGLVANNPDFYYLLMERYESKILRYIRRISNLPKETIEDLGQEIFLKAYENINDFDESLKFSSWLYRIARNHVISFWRKNKNTPMVVSFDADENFKNMLSAEGDLAKKIEEKDMAEIIGKILSQMRIDYREVLTLRFMEDKDYNEISDILKKPVGTIGTLLNRAKKELKNELEKNNFKL
ncbi:MAG: RNA polymerase, sigma-24 subunit, ECF subfamily [Candidatus Moranbacteria bacterium GW2011_GWF2_36_839]|nr:MAG: RNA polymerase, sigma-24 subunit, ECF subfamily [Candidatus Moranbacteria bacterium GW2011_GWF1_36_78]KKQ16917.1 MAG: RNA polymerase, sigma-24 subunit, ECF subfamily [Candidatus Moranbacteria bacterium GW2011_GWF2_36_839]HAT73649.1 RNA polymerase subunit sigma-24 [Candidatus Moranbacteria bacterium]HBY10494.1 RNA polymerase subunit sigma-24 [Candidatus Moranbacteria bacterium]